MDIYENEIKDIVNKETRAWDAKDAEALVSIFHPDMVWPWPVDENAHDPVDWVFPYGRYNRERWMSNWQELFDTHDLIHNKREIIKIVVSDEKDGAYAVVDIDTLWRDKNGNDFNWVGRTCKGYTKVDGVWKMIMQTGVLKY